MVRRTRSTYIAAVRGAKHRGVNALAKLRRKVRLVTVVAAVIALVAAVTVPALAADAAGGTAVLGVSIAPVDQLTGVAQTDASNGAHSNSVAYKVGYSCTGADCNNVTIQLPATQTDPYGFGQRLMNYLTWAAPFTGATIAGTATTGETVSLGNLAAGTSSSFLVVYTISSVSPSGTTTTTAAYFPSGFQIQNSATIDSSTGVQAVTANAAPVTWTSVVPNPGITMTNPGTAKPATNVTYTIKMSDGTWVSGGSGRIVGSASYEGAGSYVVVDQLPAEAQYVTSSGGGVYDAASNTVTWTIGSAAVPNVLAAGGWGSTASTWTAKGAFAPRAVTVTYPAANFSAADSTGCNFDTTVTNSITATLTYLDTAKTVKSTSTSSSHDVSCFSPFGRSTVAKDSTSDASSGATRLENVPPDVTGLTCPADHQDQWGRACTTTGAPLAPFANNIKSWTVAAYNGGNVPGVAVVTDNALDQANAPVGSITTTATTPAATIAWTEQCGTAAPTTGTSTSSALISVADQAAGCRYTAATITSGAVAASNIRPTDTGIGPGFGVTFSYSVSSTAPIGQTRTNTVTATMSYPGSPGVATVNSGTASKTIQFRAQPLVAPPTTPKPVFTAAAIPGVVSGGGLAVPGRDVTFGVQGRSQNIPVGTDITPEYVFIAPVGWTIDANSASFPAGSVPAGVHFSYSTVPVSGVDRQVVVATWPQSVDFGENVIWPTMSVVAQPTYAVAAGTTSTATVSITDSREQYDNTQATFVGGVQDTGDIDSNGSDTTWFATASTNISVSSTDGLSVTKQICEPDASASDGCDWISNPGTIVPVSPISTSIKYRVTLQNTGNTTITGAIAYDVLPYVGDTGTSAGTASSPRGSTFAETVNAASDVSDNLTLAYSASTNPARPEVDSAATGTVNDWGTTASGEKAIRATVNSSLAPGATASFTYTANVTSGAGIDAKACNSVAIASDQTLTSEPLPVCASTAEADLALTVPSRLPLQSGRPGVIPFTVTNKTGGSATAPGSVSIDIPAGITVTDLAPAGWSCATSPATPAPLDGPVTLDCAPVNSDGTPRSLATGVPDALNLPVVPTLASGSITIPGAAAGSFYDPNTANNDASGTFQIAADLAQVGLTKTDGVTAATAGQLLTYTLTASNLLVGETLTGATIADTLPAGETFVSATGGGTLSAGVVTWNLADLTEAGVANGTGTGESGGAGSTATVTLTVRVDADTTSGVTNTATVSAPDPANVPAVLTATASDTDAVRAVTITKTSDVPAIGVSVGDTITYTVTEKNIGTADFTAGSPATIADDLSKVLNEASFAGGSAQVKIDGGAATAVADPTAGVLTWSGPLPAGSTAVLTYRVNVTSGVTALTNTAYAAAPSSCTAGVDADGLPCASVTNTFAPALAIVKTAHLNDTNGNGTADAGETITYSFVVTNNGGTPAAGVTVNDAKVTGILPATATIAAGASATFTADDYTVTQADVDAGTDITNTATASGTDAGGDALPVSPPSTATVTVTAANGGLSITKTAVLNDSNGNGKADVGETIAYSFLVTNTGNVKLTGVSVHDAKVTGITPASATIDAGDSATFTSSSYMVTQADVDAGVDVSNTATVSGLDPALKVITSDPSTANVPVATADPGLTLLKTATLDDSNGNGTADVGETISYSFLVTNTGNVTESGVSITDAKVTGIAPATASIAPGASQTFTADDYTVTQADLDAGVDVTNTATATGDDPAGDPITSDPSTANTPVTAAAASLSIVKSATLGDTNGNGKVDAGETIAYSFVVTNTGNVTVHDVTVVDPKITGVTPATATLAPGEQQVFTGDSYTAVQADIDRGGVITNTATATGVDPSGTALPPSAPSTVQTPLADPAPALTIVKTGTLHDKNGNGKADAGETIAYSFVVTNTGNVTETAVTVNDAMVTGFTPASVDLIPGQVQTFTSDPYTVTAADVKRGSITNTATATGTDPAATAIVSAVSTVVTATGKVPAANVGQVLGFTGSDPRLAMGLAAALLTIGGIALAFTLRRRRRGAHR